MTLREKAKALILKNYELTGRKYIAPSLPHYKMQWLWDSCFHAIVAAELGMHDLAKNEISSLLQWQQPEGWIPHQISHGLPISRHASLEWRTFPEKYFRHHSSYTQPPLLAQAVEAIGDPNFTKEVFPKLLKFYLYFAEKRDPDKDHLISIIHPCEARDNSPEFEPLLPKFTGLRKILNKWQPLRYIKLGEEYRQVKWQIEAIWQKNLFNVEDLMFHCVWAEGLRTLAKLADTRCPQDSRSLTVLAEQAEKAVFELCWDEKEKIFCSLDNKNGHRKLRPVSISNLFPLILDNLPKTMADGLVEHLTNPTEFWTNYPIPCVSLQSGRRITRFGTLFKIWGEPTVWVNTTWFILKGLVKHGYRDLAKTLSQKTIEMVEREGFWEFYHPATGGGLRKISRNFGWSTLAITFPKIIGEK